MRTMDPMQHRKSSPMSPEQTLSQHRVKLECQGASSLSGLIWSSSATPRVARSVTSCAGGYP